MSGSCGPRGDGCGSACGCGTGAPQPIRLSIAGRGETSAPAARASEPRPPSAAPRLVIGLDVGSTTVKYVVIDPVGEAIVAKDYQRHDTRQAEKVLEMLAAIERAFPAVPPQAFRVFATGSGGAAVGRHLGASFVQEVHAVSLAVEHLYPDVESVVELGGQDAKIIVFKTVDESGRKKKYPSMNDKCAGGTGAVIDRINAKLRIPADRLRDMGYDGIRLHPVAGKCGVFAETDINSLQKQGVPPEELMASLFESIVAQNLTVLTRGHTLRPRVALLGGPNTFIRGMRECWRHHLPRLWAERNVPIAPGVDPAALVVVPDDAQYFAAIGAVRFGIVEAEANPDAGAYQGLDGLRRVLDGRNGSAPAAAGGACLVRDEQELARFLDRYRPRPWVPPPLVAGETIDAVLGLDGGSTSTKAVLLDADRRVIAKAYQLSRGNPIEDTVHVLGALEDELAGRGIRLNVVGAGTTGYAKDLLQEVIGADVALVETVAHAESGLHFHPGADVIVDVGGQDIKLIVLQGGRVKDFKLNTQCSAGNGYFLQATAASFGYDVREYADRAFAARAMPDFGYGCAVFMQSDIVDFQRQGWAPDEILAGLAAVLPKNVWLYIAQVPNLTALGTRFVLQGGTQHNLAAVKAQVDFIEARFAGSGLTPDVAVHPHCGESGAIGSALEAHRVIGQGGRRTSFIGFDRVRGIAFRTTRDERTRCYFCRNKCLRTFIDVATGAAGEAAAPVASMVPKSGDERRLIVATCEKGTVEDVAAMRGIKQGLEAARASNPNLVHLAAREAFADVDVGDSASAGAPAASGWWSRRRAARQQHVRQRRAALRIGMPRVLNMYGHAPFFIGFFRALGLPYANLVFSAYTDEGLYKRGARRGAIDPCFPSKLGIPHLHDLLYVQHARTPLTHVFFPMVDSFPTFLTGVQGSRACPTVVATPEAAHAAFVKEGDLFRERGITFKKTFLNLDQPALCARQMAADWGEALDLTPDEAERATAAGLAALARFEATTRARARMVLDRLEREDRLGVVVLGRPYHHDPGVNHEICDELQKRGYPIFSQDSLPTDADLLERVFGDEVRSGLLASPLAVDDVWKNSYSEHTNRKVWAAKFTARHPNLVALELSSFKCGHDAPIYSVIEQILERSGTPYFCFKDIDENKPTGSIRLRIETIDYFLRRHQERVAADRARRLAADARVASFAARLRDAVAAGTTVDEACAAIRAVDVAMPGGAHVR